MQNMEIIPLFIVIIAVIEGLFCGVFAICGAMEQVFNGEFKKEVMKL